MDLQPLRDAIFTYERVARLDSTSIRAVLKKAQTYYQLSSKKVHLLDEDVGALLKASQGLLAFCFGGVFVMRCCAVVCVRVRVVWLWCGFVV